VSAERADFMNLVRVEIDRLNDELAASRGGAAKLVFSSSGTARSLRPPVEPLKKALGAERLADRVPAILTRIERELDAVDARIGEKMHVLDTDGDGVVTEGELRAALGFLRDNLGDGELRALLERLEGLRAEAGAAAGDGRGAPGDVIDVAKLMELARADAEARAAKSSLTPPT
jgi:LETM1 and EF-hand domain-containing protein 1, mitochondrial